MPQKRHLPVRRCSPEPRDTAGAWAAGCSPERLVSAPPLRAASAPRAGSARRRPFRACRSLQPAPPEERHRLLRWPRAQPQAGVRWLARRRALLPVWASQRPQRPPRRQRRCPRTTNWSGMNCSGTCSSRRARSYRWPSQVRQQRQRLRSVRRPPVPSGPMAPAAKRHPAPGVVLL